MLQVGRALFREGSSRDRATLFEHALEFFNAALDQAPESAEAMACIGYTQHRLGDDDAAIASLRRALQIDNDYAESRIYLANILYDRGEYEGALYHFERTSPEDHWDELGIWRLIELKRSLYKLDEHDSELKPWDERLAELSSDLDDIDEMLIELEPRDDGANGDADVARGQLELFGTLLSSLADQRHEPPQPDSHQVVGKDGTKYAGSWEEIVQGMRDANGDTTHSLEEFMRRAARHSFRETGVHIPTHDAESFIRASANAGLLRIVR